jgi:hypothetical protein
MVRGGSRSRIMWWSTRLLEYAYATFKPKLLALARSSSSSAQFGSKLMLTPAREVYIELNDEFKVSYRNTVQSTGKYIQVQENFDKRDKKKHR